jgi:exonuclease III
MKKAIARISLGLTVLPALFILFLLFSTITEFRPPEQLVMEKSPVSDTLKADGIFSALIWNIGYAGLGANMDFFYDGGTGVRDTRANVEMNFNAISYFLKLNDSIDFLLLQEIDIDSRRSYHINQVAGLNSLLDKGEGITGINYRVGYVPVPVYSPMGKVYSGIVTYSGFKPAEAIRYAFPGSFSWPGRSFNLKRCYLVSRYNLTNGKEFILINTHNSAYDDGSLRAQEIEALTSFVQAEYRKGNYLLIGGDWNQCPSGFKPEFPQPFDTIDMICLPNDYLPGWKQAYPNDGPTNRRIKTPYRQAETLTTVIDFFIASPNICLGSLTRIDLDFAHSDHQPVIISFQLIPSP